MQFQGVRIQVQFGWRNVLLVKAKLNDPINKYAVNLFQWFEANFDAGVGIFVRWRNIVLTFRAPVDLCHDILE